MGWARVAVALVAAGLACGCATQSPARIPLASPMPEARTPAAAPPGFLSFCMRFAGQCDATSGALPTVVLDDETWRTLLQVNRTVNDSIWPQDDEVHYGRPEFWTVPSDGYGDCDDYAVTKRKELMSAGFPASALRLAVAITAENVRHAVLTVSTDRGDLVLDNLNSEVLAWNATGFTWIERQEASNPLNWGSFAAPPPGGLATMGIIAPDESKVRPGNVSSREVVGNRGLEPLTR